MREFFSRFRINVILLAVIGVIFVLWVSSVVDDDQAVIAMGAMLVGGIVAIMKDLIAPDPDPPKSQVKELTELVQVVMAEARTSPQVVGATRHAAGDRRDTDPPQG